MGKQRLARPRFKSLRQWCRREDVGEPPHYDDNEPLFTIHIRHGGRFALLPWKAYVGDYEDWFDFCHKDHMSMYDIHDMVEQLGYSGYVNYFWKIPYNDTDLHGLVYELKNESDLLKMIEFNLPLNHVIDVFLEEMSEQEMVQYETREMKKAAQELVGSRIQFSLEEIESEDMINLGKCSNEEVLQEKHLQSSGQSILLLEGPPTETGNDEGNLKSVDQEDALNQDQPNAVEDQANTVEDQGNAVEDQANAVEDYAGKGEVRNEEQENVEQGTDEQGNEIGNEEQINSVTVDDGIFEDLFSESNTIERVDGSENASVKGFKYRRPWSTWDSSSDDELHAKGSGVDFGSTFSDFAGLLREARREAEEDAREMRREAEEKREAEENRMADDERRVSEEKRKAEDKRGVEVEEENEEFSDDSGSCDTEFEDLENDIEGEDNELLVNVNVSEALHGSVSGDGPTDDGPADDGPADDGPPDDGPGGDGPDQVKGNKTMGVSFSNPTSDYEDSDEELRSCHSDESEEEERVPFFNPVTDLADPKFKLTQKFESFDILKKAVSVYSIKHRVPLKLWKNDLLRVTVKCCKGCPFLLTARRIKEGPRVQIRTLINEHRCARRTRLGAAQYKWIARTYLDTIRSQPDISIGALVAHIRRDHNIEVHRSKVHRAKALALEMIRGDEEGQYKKLADYGHELEKTNPGSKLYLGLDNLLFQKMFVCFGGSKNGFLSGCRPIISLDGCFLKGRYGGQLLTAVGIDANDCIWPIAMAVVQTESRETWSWFLNILSDELRIESSCHWTFMTDRQKGLIPAVEAVFPDAEHRFCVRHLYTNFKVKFPGDGFRDRIWAAARASYPAEFKRHMDVLKGMDTNAWAYMNEVPPQYWSRAYFREFPKCDILLNNMSECFNKFILEARDKPILTCIEVIRCKLMVRIARKRESQKKWSGLLCPKILKKLNNNIENARECHPMESGGVRFGVTVNSSLFVVDIEKRTCACRRWQITGIPCIHACSTLSLNNSIPEEFVDACYHLETHKIIYSNILEPITSSEMWEETGFGEVKAPNWKKVQRGRPKKKRKPSAGEEPSETKMGRASGLQYVCSNCGSSGHNRATCKAPLTGRTKRKDPPSNSSQKKQKKVNKPNQSERTYVQAKESHFVLKASQSDKATETNGPPPHANANRFVQQRHAAAEAEARNSSKRGRGRPKKGSQKSQPSTTTTKKHTTRSTSKGKGKGKGKEL